MDQITNEGTKSSTSDALSGLSLSLLVQAEKPNHSAVSDFGRSFAHTLVQAPIEALAQLVDGEANGSAKNAVHFLDAPEPAKFGSASWVAQQAGSGLGAILPALAIHHGLSTVMEANYATKAALAMSENMQALTTRQALGAGGLKIAQAGLTGMVYSGVFTPVKSDENNFWQARLHNTAVGGLTFGTLAGSGLGLKALSEQGAARLPLVSRALGSELASGFISGGAAGLVAANSDSLLAGKGFASWDKQAESALTFAITGAGLGYAKSRIAELRPETRVTEASGKFQTAGVDVDGRPLAQSARAGVTAKLPDYSPAELTRGQGQTLKDLGEIKAFEPGKSVLDQFRDSGLSISQKYRVLNSLTEVREHFVNQRVNGRLEPDQQGNWIHTQGEFGRVLDASRAGKLSLPQTEDALLSSMYSDAVKSKANFFTHHMDGALAADHVLSREFGAGFNRTRLDGIVHAIREHQIGPPEFMSNLYASRIRAALQFKLNPQQETALGSLQKKMADPLNPNAERYRTSDGSTALVLTNQERSLLNLTGVQDWYVPDKANSWNPVSRAVIDGDSLDNYFTPGGIGKITGLGGPESDKWFMTRQIDNATAQAERGTNIGSARMSGKDALKIITPESKALAELGQSKTEAAIETAKEHVGDWLASKKGIEPKKEAVPFFNEDLKYPNFADADSEWWNIHRTAADKRSPEQQTFYDKHRFDGLSPKEQSDFKLAKEIRDRMADELRAAQRIANDQPPQYQPSTRPGLTTTANKATLTGAARN